MWNKPFKPPLLKSVQKQEASSEIILVNPPSINKKRKRLIHIVDDDDEPDSRAPPPPLKPAIAVSLPRKPLLNIRNSVASNSSSTSSDSPETYYTVLWRKFTTKKHKTWDGDGILAVRNGYAYLQDVSGRELGKCAFDKPLLPGSALSIGMREVEVDDLLSKEEYQSRRQCVKTASKSPSNENSSSPIAIKRPSSVSSARSVPSLKAEPTITVKNETKTSSNISISSKPRPSSIKSVLGQFKTPLPSTGLPVRSEKPGSPVPLHNPFAPDALVMKRPRDCPRGKQIVDVVCDPLLVKWLRPHQRDGVKFLYECVMGLRPFNGQGALLADEMGLGKTLQTITLLWTLLKQNPVYGSEPVIKKVLIVCPATLVDNWRKEIRKWLGNDRAHVFIADGKRNRLTDFTHGKIYNIMIIGYEKLRNVQEELRKGAGIDIVIADEGHRLKTAQNKSAQAIESLDTPRRVVLSGTPLQNDLSEFFVMVDFINPGLLGKYNSFKKEFETPILKSRQPGASERDRERGEEQQEELTNLTSAFILRRTSDIIAKFLPPKSEYVLFCKPTSAQAEFYQHVLQSSAFTSVLGCSEAALQLIGILKKVCNTPSLLLRSDQKNESVNNNVATILEDIPSNLMRLNDLVASSKIRVLDQMLRIISETTKEKIVLVSNYTSTLDVLANQLSRLSLPYLRLDGSTPTTRRQDLVDTFNRSAASQHFAFLLSAKAGGAGINLIGASRLILFDVDWNPATDLQAMARIHRDGQKRPVKIYRLLMAGGMDEKIYQRQVTKMGLADSVVDGKKNEASFTAEELRDLFRLDVQSICQTHELLGCSCGGKPVEQVPQLEPEPNELGHSDSEGEGSEDDDEDLFPANPALIPASQVDWKAQEKQIRDAADARRRKQSKSKMQALMDYAHLDASVFAEETVDIFGTEKEEVADIKDTLDDEVLAKMLSEDKCKVGYIFAKHSRVEL